jgi:DNA-binding CsgD family transcriptional regulator
VAIRTEPEIAPRTPFVGRQDELEAVRRMVAEAAAGRGSFALVAGDAGAGKTRFCEESAQFATDAGSLVLTGRCPEGDTPLPYLPLLEMLESAASMMPPDDLRAAMGASAPQLAAVAPHLRIVLPDIPVLAPVPPEHERQDVFAAVRDFFDRASRARPLLLIVEDLHWADAPTMLLIRHLVTFVPHRRVVVLATYRPDEVAAADERRAPGASLSGLVDQARRTRGASVLQLGDLAEHDVTRIIAALAGREPPPEIVSRVYARTGGNPFFVEQIVAHLLEEGRLLDDAGEWIVAPLLVEDDVVPESVRAVIAQRLRRVGDACASTLVAAAVAGRGCEYDVLAAAVDMPPGALLDALDEAERANLITSSRSGAAVRLTFTHELIRETLLGSVSLPRLQRLHLRFADAIASRTAGDDREADIAHHLLRAGSLADPARTVRHALAAASRAMTATAFEQAAALYFRALELVPPDERRQRCELLLAAAEALKRVSDSEVARAAFREAAALARTIDAAPLLVRAALGFARSWPRISSVDAEAVELLRAALAVVPEDDESTRSRILSRLALQLLYAGEPEEVKARAREAVAAARRAQDRLSLARALQVLHAALWEPAGLQERLAAATEILALAPQIGEPTVALWGQRPRIADLMELGDVAAAEAELDAYERLAAESRQPIFIWQAAVRRAMMAIFYGQLDEGERLAQRALELGRRAEGQNLIAAFGGQLLVVRWQQGRLGELRALAEASHHNEPGTKLWSAVLAFIETEDGRIPQARAAFEALAADRFASLPNEDSRLTIIVLAALVCAALGDGLRAEQLYDLLLPYEERNIVVSEGVACVGAAAHYLGILAVAARRTDDAERRFAQAIEMNARTGGRPWLAHSQFEYARLLLARRRPGDRGRARDLLRTSLGIARDLGLRALQAKIDRELMARRRLAADAPDALTAREEEVLDLIARGLSTRQISERLTLSPRTTARHITNIYAKIGARNRADATAYALRRSSATG